jgi:tetratricopeptide (TPR) repeat protein
MGYGSLKTPLDPTVTQKGNAIMFLTRLPHSLCALVFAGVIGSAYAADTETTPAQNQRVDEFVAGKAAIDAKDWKTAADNFAKVVARDPKNADAYSLQGFALRWMNRYDDAFAAYAKALALNPQHKGALHYSGIAFLKTDQRAKALENLQKLQAACATCDETVTLEKAIREQVAKR